MEQGREASSPTGTLWMVTTLKGSSPSGPGLEASPTRVPLYPQSLKVRAKADPTSLAPGLTLLHVPVRRHDCTGGQYTREGRTV